MNARADSESLTHARAWRFYSPLALSWLCMAAEAPICMAIIGRSPNSEVNAAAFLLVMAVAIFIESPVIDLLSTGTALGRDRRGLAAVRRFTLLLMAVVTAVHAAVVWTPLYDLVVRGLMGQPSAVADAALWPLRILTLWSAFIGWRRFLQGVMIAQGQTRAVSVGTLARVATIGGVGWALHVAWPDQGLKAAATALLASVVVESLLITWLARPSLAMLPAEGEADPAHLTLGALLGFHLPLTAATAVMLLGQPLVSRSLAASEAPIQNAAAWQLSMSLLWLFRTATFALPEVVITLARNRESERQMRTFSLAVGAALTGLLLAAIATGADRWWLVTVLGAPESLVGPARLALLLNAIKPLLDAAMCYSRGILTARRKTKVRLTAIGVGMAVPLAGLAGGGSAKVPGIWLVSGAFLAAQLAELWVLAAGARKSTFLSFAAEGPPGGPGDLEPPGPRMSE
ncbi:MAG: hypothetical protein MH204_03630 [Fimbriimonadaceae bacterium]|nr:hypothetical protein [Fimbriimonadaceae bacterium]